MMRSFLLTLATPLMTLYHTLDPCSVSQHLAFYELYSDTEEGKQALYHAWKLLSKDSPVALSDSLLRLPLIDIPTMIGVILHQPFEKERLLGKEELSLIQTLSKRFPNHNLKGASVWTRQEVLALPPEEIDLARGLLIDQLEGDPQAKEKILQYEAILDLIALQIEAHLPVNPTPLQKLHAMNHFVFHEMQFRFPPHSTYAKDVDLYTFLPSVLDSREGVCLGVCILYLSLSQRLDLPLETITPPGHIYVRYRDHEHLINIETTARGIDLPSDVYLSLNYRKLQQRNIKEVVGLAFMNAAATSLGKQDYKQALKLYQKARDYLPKDPFLNMLYGCTLYFTGNTKEGAKVLKTLPEGPFEEAVSKETIPEDLLKKNSDAESVKILFLPVDETRNSILKKQQELLKVLKKYPRFRAGLFMLASTYLQLGRNQEALDVLKKYHALDPSSAIVEYYLAALSVERLNYPEGWIFLKNAEKLTSEREHAPKALKGLRQNLRLLSPE